MALPISDAEPARHFASPQEEMLINLMRSADCLHRSFQLRLRPFGLTSTQYNVLRILRAARPQGMTCSGIGRGMITPEPDITRLLARLKAQKFLRQQRDPKDRRVVWTHITDHGLETLDKLDGVVDQTTRELLSGLQCEEVGELTRLLKKARCCEDHQASETQPRSRERAVSGKRPSPQPPHLPHHPE
jgi:DNA-binding MarR family transcriptional regulator